MNKKSTSDGFSEDLFDEIIAKAKKNRATFSHLIRNLVEDFLEITEDFGDLASEKARMILFGKERGEVLGYQSFPLLKDTECALCERELHKGETVRREIRENSSLGNIICEKCFSKEEAKQKRSK